LGLLTLFIIWFFRNPERITPQNPAFIISPADGRVIRIEDVAGHELLAGPLKKISIFMNVFNVHVNRAPCDGTVEAIKYYEGRFLSANLDKASLDNERNAVILRMVDGRRILTIQIAGLIARRIVCWIAPGMEVRKGERFGLIRFGSRLDVFLPQDTKVLVALGEHVRAGETPLGELS
jgi:phosphatidylserine decarboxylase